MLSCLKNPPDISIFAILKEAVTAVRAAGMHAIAQNSSSQGTHHGWVAGSTYHFLCSTHLSDFDREELRFIEEVSQESRKFRVRCMSIGIRTSTHPERLWTHGSELSLEVFVRQCISDHLRHSFENRQQ